MRRTQIYLDEDQKTALKALALHLDSTVSDLVREAVSRMLRDDVRTDALADRFERLQERIRESVIIARGGEPSDGEIDAVAASARSSVAKKRGRA